MDVHLSALPLKNHFKIFVTLAFPNKIKLSIDKKKVRYKAEIDAKRSTEVPCSLEEPFCEGPLYCKNRGKAHHHHYQPALPLSKE